MSGKQCRICLDRDKPLAGDHPGVIGLCKCKQDQKFYAHLDCLERWRSRTPTSGISYTCSQCHFKYNYYRLRFAGLAENKIVVGGLSTLLFMCIVMCSSFITTYFMDAFDGPSSFGGYFFFVSPYAVGQDLVAAAFRIIRDGDIASVLDRPVIRPASMANSPLPSKPPSIFQRLLYRFFIGLPLVGAGSIVQVLLSFGMLAPTQFIARYRAMRNRRDRSQDLAALIVIGLLVAGALKALFEVYKLTRKYSHRTLSTIERAIVNVN